MPKIRSHRGAMKRFKVTKKGLIKRSRACTGHLKEKKSAKKKRVLRKTTLLNRKDVRRIRKLIIV